MHPLALLGIGGAVIAALVAMTRKSSASSTTTLESSNAPQLDMTDSPDVLESPPAGVDPQTQADIDSQLASEKNKIPAVLPSPLSGVSEDAWTKYVLAWKTGKLNTVTAGMALGLWQTGMRLLQDVGMVKNVKLVPVNGKQVWKGEFVPPLTLDIFLSDASVQYEAFKRATVRDANYLRSKYASKMKADNITLSGLLAVARYAGLKGSELWLTKPEERKAATTAIYEKFKGYF